MVEFATLNLVADTYPSAYSGTQQTDMILRRNVLIYFSPATTTPVFHRLFQCQRPRVVAARIIRPGTSFGTGVRCRRSAGRAGVAQAAAACAGLIETG